MIIVKKSTLISGKTGISILSNGFAFENTHSVQVFIAGVTVAPAAAS
jgi:hypothetical protein